MISAKEAKLNCHGCNVDDAKYLSEYFTVEERSRES